MDVCTPSTPPQHTHMQRENTKIWMDRGRGVTRKGWEDKERCEEEKGGEGLYSSQSAEMFPIPNALCLLNVGSSIR